jgi:hypothetical protein
MLWILCSLLLATFVTAIIRGRYVFAGNNGGAFLLDCLIWALIFGFLVSF